MTYRCEVASVNGFVQQLACNLINKGYWHYVVGEVPERKAPDAVDRKLIDLYGLDQSKWARARRKTKGLANVAYLRHERFFVLVATKGDHILFQREAAVRDFRRKPLRFHGYSIGCGKGSDGRYHASVRIDEDMFFQVRAYLLELATHRSPESLQNHFENVFSFTPYARIRRQILRLVREINEKRRTAGFALIAAPSLRRQIVRPFKEVIDRSELALSNQWKKDSGCRAVRLGNDPEVDATCCPKGGENPSAILHSGSVGRLVFLGNIARIARLMPGKRGFHLIERNDLHRRPGHANRPERKSFVLS